MADAQKRIWAFHYGPWVGYFVGTDPGAGTYLAEFHRADLSRDLVRAAFERAAESADSVALPMDGRLAKAQAHYMRSVIRDTIRAIAKDDEAVAAIIASVLGETK